MHRDRKGWPFLPPVESRCDQSIWLVVYLVVVGDLIGSGEAQERGIVGETPNLAARPQAIAEPDMVDIADGTRKLLGNLFELQDLGPKDLKGIAGPVRAWSALRTSSAEDRFEAMHATGLTDLVGREEELELLLRRWSKAKTGEGQVVLLSGEAGIGKSRLTAALLERLATEPHTRLRNFCSPQHTDSAFYPIIGQMVRAAGLARDDKPQAKLDKLDAMLAQSSTSTQDAALFAEMLSLPNDGRYPALDLTPQQRRQRTLEALVLQVVALSRQNPALMIFEDAHWTDPTSLELLGRIVDKIPTLRVLLIVTFRPEFEPPWIGRPYVTALTINRLADREVGAVIDRVTGNKPLPANIRLDIIERTDGIPLFVEEMTKAVLEGENEGTAERTVATIRSLGLAVPATLHASLMARLDRLGPAKQVAQIGAALGREFPYATLAAVARKAEADLSNRTCRFPASGFPAGFTARHATGPLWAVWPRWTALLRLDCCFDRARHRTRLTCSNMRWCKMRRTAPCCASPDVPFMLALPRPSKVNSPKSLKTSPNCWRVIAPRLAYREGREPMGQGGPAVAGALGAGRSRSSVHQSPRSDRGLAGHIRAASRPD